MIEGAFAIKASTPFGTKHGTAVIASKDTRVLSKVTIEGSSIKLEGRIIDDSDTFAITGNYAHNETFQLIGSIAGDVLRAQFITKDYAYDIKGTRIQTGN
ncbi:MAG: hypothetical protein IJ125_01640 [Atopobiaceae bacterium]|nr:hypothetical protein [Atopobiaceae bacterium]